MSRDVLGHRDVAVDRCWTLLPLSTLSAMLSAMVHKNSALFYVAFMNEFGVSHQAASWPITVHGVVTHLTGLLVSLLQKKLSTYQIALSGSLLNFIGLVASAFAPTAAWMTFTLGVVGGVGYGMVVISLSIYAMVYFDRYRGTASGCKYTGMTLAPLAFPLALSALIRMYNLSGTLLILSAITLHTLPIAMLMNNPRPVTSCFGKKKRREALADTFCRDYGSKSSRKQQASVVIYRRTASSQSSQEGAYIFLSQKNSRNPARAQQANLPEPRKHIPIVSSATAHGCGHSFVEDANGFIPKPPLAITVWATDDKRNYSGGSSIFGENQENGFNCLRKIEKNRLVIGTRDCTVKKSSSSDTASTDFRNLLRSPLLYLFVATFTVNEYATDTFEMTVLDYCIDKGSERSQAEPIITYVAAAQLIGRLTVPFLWERAGLRRSLLVALSLTIAAISLAVIPQVNNFTLVMLASLAMGCSSGCVVVLKPVLLSDHLGVQMLPFCWGLAGIAMVPFAFGGSLLIGLFRDAMGSYDNLYRTMSAFSIVFAIMLFTFAFFERRAEKRPDYA